MNKIWTIGHSKRSIEQFIRMLRAFDIQVLADVRSMPGSKVFPHFNQTDLSKALENAGVHYVHMPDLGGRKKLQTDTDKPFGGYADHMQTDVFEKAINQLQEIAQKKRLVYMCAEANWWKCHRSFISEYLYNEGWEVMHIMTEGKATSDLHFSVVHPKKEMDKPLGFPEVYWYGQEE